MYLVCFLGSLVVYIFSGFSVQKADIIVESNSSLYAISLCLWSTFYVYLRLIIPSTSTEASFFSSKPYSSSGLYKVSILFKGFFFLEFEPLSNYISSMIYSSWPCRRKPPAGKLICWPTSRTFSTPYFLSNLILSVHMRFFRKSGSSRSWWL